MRILFVGDVNLYSRSIQRLNAFKSLGCHVVSINIAEQGFTPGLSSKSPFTTRLFEKFGYPLDPMAVNKKLIEQSAHDFDVIWVEKAMMVRPSTVAKIKSLSNATLIFYSNDNLEKRHNQSRYMLKSLAKYDFVITINGYSEMFYKNLGVKNLIKIRRSHDKGFLEKKSKIRKNPRDAVFIGSFEASRFRVLEHLALNGIPITVFGNGWPLSSNPLLTIARRPVYEEQFIEEVQNSKLVFNFLRKINDDTSTGRTFEIAALGGFLFSEDSEPHRRYFEEGKEAVFFSCSDMSGTLEKCRLYLENVKKRTEISRAGRQRCIVSEYDHEASLSGVLSLLNQWPDGEWAVNLDIPISAIL